MRGSSTTGIAWGARRTVAAVCVAFAGLALVAAGCGGDDAQGVARAEDAAASTTGTTGTSTVSQADRDEALLKFAKCMREQGVDYPDPQPDENGNLRPQRPDATGTGDRAEFQTAQEACRQYLEAARPQLTDEQRQEREDQLLAFSKCMREEGVEDFPDPSADTGPGAFRDAIDPDDPATQKALETCQERVGGFGIPGGGGAPPGGGGTPPGGAPSGGGNS
ncbi:MAG: hypothetical protein IT200_13520 [Thermoleophilia bacterium]|nr:hypothetical protein [Thermoleophilia bacterium]